MTDNNPKDIFNKAFAYLRAGEIAKAQLVSNTYLTIAVSTVIMQPGLFSSVSSGIAFHLTQS